MRSSSALCALLLLLWCGPFLAAGEWTWRRSIGAPQLRQLASVQELAWSSLGDRIAARDGAGVVRIWSAADGQLLREVETAMHVQGLAWPADDRLVLAGTLRAGAETDAAAGLVVIDPATGVVREADADPRLHGCGLALRGGIQALVRRDAGVLVVVLRQAGRVVREVRTVSGYLTTAPWLSPAGDALIMAGCFLGAEASLLVCHDLAGRLRWRVPMHGNGMSVLALAGSADGRRLAMTVLDNGALQTWIVDAITGAVQERIWSGGWARCEEDAVVICDAMGLVRRLRRDGRVERRQLRVDSQAQITAVAWSHDGRMAIGDARGGIHIHDGIRTLIPPPHAIEQLAATGDGRWLVAVERDAVRWIDLRHGDRAHRRRCASEGMFASRQGWLDEIQTAPGAGWAGFRRTQDATSWWHQLAPDLPSASPIEMPSNLRQQALAADGHLVVGDGNGQVFRIGDAVHEQAVVGKASTPRAGIMAVAGDGAGGCWWTTGQDGQSTLRLRLHHRAADGQETVRELRCPATIEMARSDLFQFQLRPTGRALLALLPIQQGMEWRSAVVSWAFTDGDLPLEPAKVFVLPWVQGGQLCVSADARSWAIPLDDQRLILAGERTDDGMLHERFRRVVPGGHALAPLVGTAGLAVGRADGTVQIFGPPVP